jgi:DNA-binding response OmpR family regulator
MRCHACGQEVRRAADGLVVSLDDDTITFRGTTVRVPGRRAELLSAMVEMMPRTAMRGYLVERVWGVMEQDATAKNLDTHIWAIRRSLPPGLRIKTVVGRDYRLEIME